MEITEGLGIKELKGEIENVKFELSNGMLKVKFKPAREFLQSSLTLFHKG